MGTGGTVNAKILAQGERGRNRVALLALLDEVAGMRNPPLYLVAFCIDTPRGLQHWARSVSDPTEARELYDQCVLDHVFEPEPSFHGDVT